MLNEEKVFEDEQEKFCLKEGYEFFPVASESVTGYAIETEGQLPINGLRHPPEKSTNGWYIWYGEELSEVDEFFSPLHANHLLNRCPEIVKFLGLPPGYRFLLAGDYLDIWYDESLLDIS